MQHRLVLVWGLLLAAAIGGSAMAAADDPPFPVTVEEALASEAESHPLSPFYDTPQPFPSGASRAI